MGNTKFNLYCMYHEIKRLRQIEHRSIQWIADHLKLNFRTVKKLLDMEAETFVIGNFESAEFRKIQSA